MFDMENLKFSFVSENGDMITSIVFNSIEDLDLCIERLQEARSEFEHRIEMRKAGNMNRRKRRKEHQRKTSNVNLGEMEKSYNNLLASYEAMPDVLKELFKPVMDSVTALVEESRKESYGKSK